MGHSLGCIELLPSPALVVFIDLRLDYLQRKGWLRGRRPGVQSLSFRGGRERYLTLFEEFGILWTEISDDAIECFPELTPINTSALNIEMV